MSARSKSDWTSEKRLCAKKPVAFSLIVSAHDGSSAKKRGQENFQPRTSRRKKWRLPISAVKKMCRGPSYSQVGRNSQHGFRLRLFKIRDACLFELRDTSNPLEGPCALSTPVAWATLGAIARPQFKSNDFQVNILHFNFNLRGTQAKCCHKSKSSSKGKMGTVNVTL